MSSDRRSRLRTAGRRLLLALLVVAAGASMVWYRNLALEEEPQIPEGPPAAETKADMVIREFRHTETHLDRILWTLESERAEIFEQQAHLHVVKILWYGEKGTATPLVITSEDGLVDFRKRYAMLSGKVRVERSDGAVLLTERLIFDETRKRLRAPLPLTIVTEDFRLQGGRLDVDLDTQYMLLRGSVQGEVTGAALGQRPS